MQTVNDSKYNNVFLSRNFAWGGVCIRLETSAIDATVEDVASLERLTTSSKLHSVKSCMAIGAS